MTHPTMQPQALHQQVLALGLAMVITAGVLSGLVGLAQGEQAAHLAQQVQGAPQALRVVPAAPAA